MSLGKDVWASREVTQVFIQLRESDHKLFIGLSSKSSAPLAFNPFLADLRNNAVDDAAHVLSEGPMIQPSAEISKGADCYRERGKVPRAETSAIEEFVKREEASEPMPSDGPDSYRAQIARPCCKAQCTAWIMYEGRACNFLEEWDRRQGTA